MMDAIPKFVCDTRNLSINRMSLVKTRGSQLI